MRKHGLERGNVWILVLLCLDRKMGKSYSTFDRISNVVKYRKRIAQWSVSCYWETVLVQHVTYKALWWINNLISVWWWVSQDCGGKKLWCSDISHEVRGEGLFGVLQILGSTSSGYFKTLKANGVVPNLFGLWPLMIKKCLLMTYCHQLHISMGCDHFNQRIAGL